MDVNVQKSLFQKRKLSVEKVCNNSDIFCCALRKHECQIRQNHTTSQWSVAHILSLLFRSLYPWSKLFVNNSG